MHIDIEKIRSVSLIAVKGFEPRITILYLYGSRAAGTENAESDFDFAIAATRPLSHSERGTLAERLGDALLESRLASSLPEVDAVDIRSIPLTLAAQILESGIVILGEEDPERGFLETRLMSEYAELNEERREVLEAIMDRGSIYARP
jgi:predicted nucleotidyltransferase